jgi:GTPase
MQFVDEVIISVHAGDGGDGCVAFRREAHVPRGGPSGGDGGRGGDVVLVCDPGLTTLLDLRYQREYKAKRGQHGQGHDCFGKGSDPVEIRVPCGTVVLDDETGEILADLVEPHRRFVVAAGGKGGRGNMRFTSPTNRAPRRADPGEPGEERRLRLELKLLADVGIVGLPNAGKSTLISRISAARPKVADYPFTTLAPSLGVVRLGEERTFVVADIPGLIEGSHLGVGLGTRFLRHVERTRTLLFLLDDRRVIDAGEDPAAEGPLADLALLEQELSSHDEELAGRRRVIALNKADLLSEERLEDLVSRFARAGHVLHPLSALTGRGREDLLEALWRELSLAKQEGAARPPPGGVEEP